MKKFDYFILTALTLEMIVTYVFRLSLSAGILVVLTTMLPLVVLALVGGRFIQSISNKFSVFNILASAIIATLIVLPYSLLSVRHRIFSQCRKYSINIDYSDNSYFAGVYHS